MLDAYSAASVRVADIDDTATGDAELAIPRPRLHGIAVTHLTLRMSCASEFCRLRWMTRHQRTERRRSGRSLRWPARSSPQSRRQVSLRTSSSLPRRASWMSTISPMSAQLSRLKSNTSIPRRLRNSGRKMAHVLHHLAALPARPAGRSLSTARCSLPRLLVSTIQHVLEVDRATLASVRATVVQHLQQHVEDVGMRAFSTSSNSTTW